MLLLPVVCSLDLPRRAFLVAPAGAFAPDSSWRDPRPLLYRIDNGYPAQMQPFEGKAVEKVKKQLATLDVVLIGIRRNDDEDAACAAALASDLASYRSAVVGMDSDIPALRDLGLPLVPLGVADDALLKIQRGGTLDPTEISTYIENPTEFENFASTPGFDMYAQRTIKRRYDNIDDEKKPPFSGYFSSAILMDEAIATQADRVKNNLLIAVVNDDRVKFGLGAQARLEARGRKVRSVLVNPSADSTYSSIKRIRLTLSEDATLGYVPRTLADYVLFSASPPPNLLTHMMNPIDGSWKIDWGLSQGGSDLLTSKPGF